MTQNQTRPETRLQLSPSLMNISPPVASPAGAGAFHDVQNERPLLASKSYTKPNSLLTIPDVLLYKIYNFIHIEDVKSCRLVCQRFNATVISSNLLADSSAFVFDGRRDTAEGSKCGTYFEELLNGRADSAKRSVVGESGCSLWSTMIIRRAYHKQLGWISNQFTSSITTLSFMNCSLTWFNLLTIFTEFENLVSFTDFMDLFFWDYASFSEGIRDNEDIMENAHYKQLIGEYEEDVDSFLPNLANLKHISIRRCHLSDCVLYMKIFLLKCSKLETIDITTDQSISPRPFQEFYNYLGQIISANAQTLRNLWFPYKTLYPATEFHILDAANPFNIFLNYITENNWGTAIVLRNLTNLTIQFPAIQIDERIFQEKLLPFLLAWTTAASTSFKSLTLNCVYLESGKEHALADCIPSSIPSINFGVWLLDSDGIPFIEHILNYIQYIHIQLWRPISTELRHILMLDDEEIEEEEGEIPGNDESPFEDLFPRYPKVEQLQFFNKAANFRNFNLELIVRNFPNLTHLNLVDYNTRVDRLHSSESPATVEDDELQSIIKCLPQLVLLQLIGNMTYVTDFGMTGVKLQGCKRMLKRNDFTKIASDMAGCPFSTMRKLQTLVLRGVGIKVTDVTAHHGFVDMRELAKLHVHGAHQISRTGKTFLTDNFHSMRGCDVQI